MEGRTPTSKNGDSASTISFQLDSESTFNKMSKEMSDFPVK